MKTLLADQRDPAGRKNPENGPPERQEAKTWNTRVFRPSCKKVIQTLGKNVFFHPFPRGIRQAGKILKTGLQRTGAKRRKTRVFTPSCKKSPKSSIKHVLFHPFALKLAQKKRFFFVALLDGLLKNGKKTCGPRRFGRSLKKPLFFQRTLGSASKKKLLRDDDNLVNFSL